jgi:hypothetical protein
MSDSKSAKWAKADIDQVAVTESRFHEYAHAALAIHTDRPMVMIRVIVIAEQRRAQGNEHH